VLIATDRAEDLRESTTLRADKHKKPSMRKAEK
jgi:hypothetical protein